MSGELHRISDKNGIVYLYEYNEKDIAGASEAVVRIMSLLPQGFGQTMTFHMENLGITNEKLSDLSLVSPRTVTRMRGAKKQCRL